MKWFVKIVGLVAHSMMIGKSASDRCVAGRVYYWSVCRMRDLAFGTMLWRRITFLWWRIALLVSLRLASIFRGSELMRKMSIGCIGRVFLALRRLRQ